MRKLLTFIILMTALTGSAFLRAENMESTLNELKGTLPREGVVARLVSVDLNFAGNPHPNLACPNPATLTDPTGMTYSIYSTQQSKLQQYSEGMADTEILIVFASSPLSSPGLYTVHIPAEFIYFNDEDGTKSYNEEINLEYEILKPAKIVCDPVPGYYNVIPTTITVTFPEVETIVDNKVVPDEDNQGSIYFSTPRDLITMTDGDGIMKIEGNKIYFHISDVPITGAGIFELRIYPGSLTLVYPGGKEVPVTEYWERWIHPLIPKPEISPAEGEVYELGDISFTLEDGSTFGMVVASPGLYKNVNGNPTDKTSLWKKEKGIVRGDQTINYITSTPCTSPGEYIVKLGRSAFSACGPYNDTYYLGDPEEEGDDDDDDMYYAPGAGGSSSIRTFGPQYANAADEIVEVWNNCDYYYYFTILPFPGTAETGLNAIHPVSTLSEMIIYFPNAREELYDNTSHIADEIKIFNRYFIPLDEYSVEVVEVNETAEPKFARLRIEPEISKNDMFYVSVPEGAFVADDEDSRAFTQGFMVDPTVGIDPARLEDGVDVYSIAGVRVAENVTKKEIDNLPPGLYIIGGKKLIKK